MGWLDKFEKAQDGSVKYGTPEYKAAYESGAFVGKNFDGNDIYNQLDEVVLTADKKTGKTQI